MEENKEELSKPTSGETTFNIETDFKIEMVNSLEGYLKWKKYKKDHEPKIGGKDSISYGTLFE